MENIIVELWRAEVEPSMCCAYNEEILADLRQLVGQSAQWLSERIGAEEKERLSRLVESYAELISAEQENAFVKGFSLGMRLAVQALG